MLKDKNVIFHSVQVRQNTCGSQEEKKSRARDRSIFYYSYWVSNGFIVDLILVCFSQKTEITKRNVTFGDMPIISKYPIGSFYTRCPSFAAIELSTNTFMGFQLFHEIIRAEGCTKSAKSPEANINGTSGFSLIVTPTIMQQYISM